MRYGLIGCGGIARGHLSAYGHLFDLVACCDLHEPAADEFQRRFGFQRTYTDFRTMLDGERLDFVTVCTSTTHDRLDIVLACAAAGVHPLVETPMALTREQAWQMVAACAEAGVKLAVSQQYRNFPHVKAACDLLRSGTLGRPFLGELRMAHLGWFPLKGAKPSDYFVKFDKVLLLNGTVHHSWRAATPDASSSHWSSSVASPSRTATSRWRRSPVTNRSAWSAMAIATWRMSSDRARVAAVCSVESRMATWNTCCQSGTARRNLPKITSRSNSCSAIARCASLMIARPPSARKVFRISSS